ncbi:MAG TPA: alpha/beta hydrolase [Prosthecochloris aestuarii]|uniref:Alpha/beta hydrolase n=1 Tax=Prosthecochloris aestuarii TaxID=1102 RepID=A0A831WVL1_PROAE|nr:alpha/beta hydrolase [Prosthecochloris aestuarii]
MDRSVQNPVIIIPGVLFWDGLYAGMKDALSSFVPREKITIVPVSLLDWVGFPPSPERSTNRVMAALDRTVQMMQDRFPGERITLVAHSGGGTVALIYLLEKEFQGDVYHRRSAVGKLLTLGTPFVSREYYAKIKTDFIHRHLDPSFFRHCSVVSVVGSDYRGDLSGSIAERVCYHFYRNVAGKGELSGDGIVPVESCILEGAELVPVSGVEHLPTPHTSWYGTKEGVAQWVSLL